MTFDLVTMNVIEACFTDEVKHTYEAICKNAYMLGENLKKRRKALGIEVAELALAVGVTPQAIYGWEKKADINVRPEHLVKAARKLRTTVEDLVFPKSSEAQPVPVITERERLMDAYDSIQNLDEDARFKYDRFVQMLIKDIEGEAAAAGKVTRTARLHSVGSTTNSSNQGKRSSKKRKSK